MIEQDASLVCMVAKLHSVTGAPRGAPVTQPPW